MCQWCGASEPFVGEDFPLCYRLYIIHEPTRDRQRRLIHGGGRCSLLPVAIGNVATRPDLDHVVAASPGEAGRFEENTSS